MNYLVHFLFQIVLIKILKSNVIIRTTDTTVNINPHVVYEKETEKHMREAEDDLDDAQEKMNKKMKKMDKGSMKKEKKEKKKKKKDN